MICIVTARMTSSRFPGKSLRGLAGRELLGRVLDRVRSAQFVSSVIVATSTDDSDDPLAEFCAQESTHCFRGSLHDVASRLLAAADESRAQTFVRISGDSPVIDPQLINRAVEVFLQHRPDLVTNVFPRTFPAGQSVEVIATESLRRLWLQQHDLGNAADLNEHVTKGFYAAPDSWNIVNIVSAIPGPHPSLAVDTPDDLARVDRLVRRLSDGPSGWRDLLRMLDAT
jgi:spore coat polysaccharide biosynthesis protein SpsF